MATNESGARPSEAELDELRARVRATIAEHAPPIVAREGHRAPTSPEQEVQLRTWFRVLWEQGFVGADWPVDHGGRADHHPLHALVVSEEILRARAPRPVDQVNLAAHVLLRFGTDEQRARYLPPIRRSEHIWCQLLSEPDAGSDIAAVRTRADVQPDGSLVVNGQKTWITDAHWADMGLALLRTDPSSTRQHGLTMAVVPLAQPGIEVRPIVTMGDSVDVNEVFFDDVLIPASDVIGATGQGWSIIMAGLDVERFGMAGNATLLELLVEDLATVVGALEIAGRPARGLDDVRQQLAELTIQAGVARAVVDDHVERVLSGREGEGDAAVAKIAFAETYHQISSAGTTLAASGTLPIGALDARAALGRIHDSWLWSRAYTVSAGSSEMMRNIIAKRRLRLPQAPRPMQESVS